MRESPHIIALFMNNRPSRSMSPTGGYCKPQALIFRSQSPVEVSQFEGEGIEMQRGPADSHLGRIDVAAQGASAPSVIRRRVSH
jgi:hypothetical protein